MGGREATCPCAQRGCPVTAGLAIITGTCSGYVFCETAWVKVDEDQWVVARSTRLKHSRLQRRLTLAVYLFIFCFNGCRVEIRAGRSSDTVQWGRDICCSRNLETPEHSSALQGQNSVYHCLVSPHLLYTVMLYLWLWVLVDHCQKAGASLQQHIQIKSVLWPALW